MREILFRAKHIHATKKNEHLNGRWVYGYLSDENHINSPELEGEFLVDQETICQYTGFTDKNGKKIWENDILRGHGNNEDLVKVVFGEFKVIDAGILKAVDSVIGWHTEVVETDALSECEPFNFSMPLKEYYIGRSEFEVHGNIFDNPELLN